MQKDCLNMLWGWTWDLWEGPVVFFFFFAVLPAANRFGLVGCRERLWPGLFRCILCMFNRIGIWGLGRLAKRLVLFVASTQPFLCSYFGVVGCDVLLGEKRKKKNTHTHKGGFKVVVLFKFEECMLAGVAAKLQTCTLLLDVCLSVCPSLAFPASPLHWCPTCCRTRWNMVSQQRTPLWAHK